MPRMATSNGSKTTEQRKVTTTAAMSVYFRQIAHIRKAQKGPLYAGLFVVVGHPRFELRPPTPTQKENTAITGTLLVASVYLQNTFVNLLQVVSQYGILDLARH